MEIDDLHYFTASASAGNFSRAANVLGRSASTLSRRISRLENVLGLPLFERRPGGVKPTSGGRIILIHVRRALAEMQSYHSALVSSRVEQTPSWPGRPVLLGLRRALAGILKALHLTGSEPQSRRWRDGNSYSTAKDHTRSGPSSSMFSCGPTRRKIIANRLALRGEESVSVGHRRYTTG
jgi:DNA-binding transcriptional LysR family regulator